MIVLAENMEPISIKVMLGLVLKPVTLVSGVFDDSLNHIGQFLLFEIYGWKSNE